MEKNKIKIEVIPDEFRKEYKKLNSMLILLMIQFVGLIGAILINNIVLMFFFLGVGAYIFQLYHKKYMELLGK